MTKTKLSIIALLAAATAFPALAAADHRPTARPTMIGDVGTHRHDAEDFIQVPTYQRFDRLELRAQGRPVPIDGVQIHFTDGTQQYASVRGYAMPGQGVMIDLPDQCAPIKMLVLDYGNRGPYWRAHEDARVQVFGFSDRYNDDRYDDYRYDDYRRPVTVIERPVHRPSYDRDRYEGGARFEWRGGVYVRVR